MNPAYLNRVVKGLVMSCLLFVSTSTAFAQCPGTPGTCTITINANSTANVNLAAGQNLCITGGTYTGTIGSIPSSSTVYVAPGAVFNPTAINGYAGRIRNCGNATIASLTFSSAAADSARFENYGISTLGSVQYNSNNVFVNGLNAKLTFSVSQNLNNTRIYNKGSIRINGALTTNGNNVIIYNEDSLTTAGDITLNGKILNTGYLFANGGLMKLNANGTITNGCYFVSQGSFEYNGSFTDPLIVTGFIWARGAEVKTNGSGLLILQPGAFIQGNNFNSDGTVRGTGDFYFSGNTKNQGTFGADGTPTTHLNFYDATKTGAVFDQGNQPPAVNNVTTNLLTPKDNTSFVPGTCSDIIKEQYCDVNAGPDVTACNVATYNLPDALAAQSWSFLSGPVTASITANTGVVTGMTAPGDYFFVIAKPLLATCKDTVKITRYPLPPVPKITGPLYVCQNSTAALPDSATYIWYTVPLGGTGLSPAPSVVSTVAGTTSYYVSRRVNGCESARIRYDVIVNPSPNESLVVSGSTVCATSPNASVTVQGTRIGESYQAFEGGIAKGIAVISAGGLVTLTVPLGQLSSQLDTTVRYHRIEVRASIPGCVTVVLSDTATVTINRTPNATLIVSGSTVCASSPNATVTVASTISGQAFQAYEGNTPIGPNFVSTGGNVILTLPLGQTIGSLDTTVRVHTIRVTASVPGCSKIVPLTDTGTVFINRTPNPGLTVRGSTVCANSPSANVTVAGTTMGQLYQAYEGNTSIGQAVSSTGGTVTLILPLGQTLGRLDTTVRIHTIQVTASVPGCSKTVPLTDTGTVVINRTPDAAMAVRGDTVCSNSAVANFTIRNTLKDQVFQAFLKKVAVGLPAQSTADGSDVVLTIPVSVLGVGDHFITVTASVNGCKTITLRDSANVRVNQLPSNNPTITGDTICSDSIQARVFLSGTQSGVRYSAYNGTTLVGTAVATGTTLTISINANGFSIGSNFLDLTASIQGCGLVNISRRANVYVNPRPNYTLSFTASGPVCIGGLSTITIINAEKNVIYTILDNGVAVDTILGKGVTISKTISMQQLGSRTITLLARINGCSQGALNESHIVTVNDGSDITLDVTATSPVCVGTPIFVRIPNSDTAAFYKAYNGTMLVSDSIKGTGTTIILKIDSLPAGIYDLAIRATTGGCGTFELVKKPRVVVDDTLSAGLTVLGSTVCNNSDSATVTISGVKKRQIYTTFLNGVQLSKDSVVNDGTVVVYLLVKDLKEGDNKINIKASVGGCGAIELKDSALIIVNKNPDITLSVTNDTVCENTPFAMVEVIGTKKGETYNAFINETFPVDTVLSDGGSVFLNVPVSSLKIDTVNKITIGVFIPGCGLQTLNRNSFILVNKLPLDTFAVIGDTVCSGRDFAQVTIKSTLVNQVFQAYDERNNRPIGLPKKSLGREVVLDIPVFGTFPKGFFKIYVKVTIRGCDSTFLRDAADLLVNDAPQPTLAVIGDTICTNSDTAYVQILGTQISETYVARLNGVNISDSVLSTGDTVILKIPSNKLPLDTNEVTIFTDVIGCGESSLLNKAWIIINPLPTDSLIVEGDTVCENATEAIVRIINATKDVIYSAWLNNQLVSDPVTSNGTDVFLRLPIGKLALDTNKIGVLASIKGCADVALKDSALVIVNKAPSTSLDVQGSTVCSSADFAQVTTLGSNKGGSYQALINGATLGQPVIGSGQPIVLNLPVSGLPLDTNIISISVTVSGCVTGVLDERALVIVNKLPSDTLGTEGSTVCSSSLSASVTVFNTQKNVGYQAFINNDTVGTVIISSGGTIQLPVFVNQLKLGVNRVVVKTSLEKCNVITLKDTALVIISDNPAADSVIVDGTSVCPGQDGFATLKSAKIGVTYNLLVNNATTSLSVLGTGKSDTLTVPASLLSNGANKITFTANIPSCNTVGIKDDGTVYVLRSNGFNVTGDDWLCYGSTGQFSTGGIDGSLSYYWSVGDSARIVSGQGTQVITAQFDSISSYVAVKPVGYYGICRQDSALLPVTIKAPITGIPTVTGKDTVCTGQIDTLQVIGQKGVLYYEYKIRNFLKGINLVNTLPSDSASDSLVVRYKEAGWKVFVFYPYSECARKTVDSVVKLVRVLATPVAEANEYDFDETMFVGTANVNLNGRGSTVGDTISYKWYTEKGIVAQIENPTSQNGAILNTAAKEIKVYLTVSNSNVCSVTDSAIIKLNFDLDIPNVFSPNNDGTHDIWEIKNISTFYPNSIVEVFNKWGSLIWKSDVGYHVPWDGKRNGEDMPVATYYYVLDRKNGSKPNVGSVTIIR